MFLTFVYNQDISFVTVQGNNLGYRRIELSDNMSCFLPGLGVLPIFMRLDPELLPSDVRCPFIIELRNTDKTLQTHCSAGGTR